MRSKFTWMLTLFMALALQFSFAQEKNVTGTVVDQDGLPLPGASVMVQGTARGTQTDFDGNYAIRASEGDILVFSYIGQETKEVAVGASSTLDVVLESSAEALGEVVVQGYRTATKEKSSIASQTISAETIENRPNASFVQTLSGQVAGLNITTASGQPGAASNVNLRGIGSINGNTQPLYIIDGTPVDQDNFRSLNPQDIASISVLKDAGATAIYGNRGANGVIIIKTRQGGFESPLAIKYTGIMSYTTLQGNDYNLMDSQQQLQLEKLDGSGLGSTLTDEEIAGYATTDWVDVFFRTGLTQNHTLSLTSGGDKVSQFTSFGYYDQEGILVDSDLKRFNMRSNISGKSEDEKFRYNTNVTLNFSKSNEPNSIGSGAINRNYVLAAFQSVPYLSPDDYTTGEALLSPLLFSNTPLFLLDRLATYTRFEEELKFVGSIDLAYDITDDLTLRSVTSSDYQSEFLTRAEESQSFNALLFGGAANPLAGFMQQRSTRQFTFNQTTSLNWGKTFGKHTVDLGAYTEYFKAHLRRFGYFAEGLDPKTFFPGDGAGLVDDTSENDFYADQADALIRNAGLFSYFGTADYDYDSRYGLSGTIRRDASYRFAESNRWGTFWSVAGRWNMHNEAFLENSSFIDVLKLRASYGTSGNQNVVGGSYFAGPDLTQSFYGTGPGYGGTNSILFPGAGGGQIGNDTLRWEEIVQANVGVDFELFNSRLRGAFDWYDKQTNDLYQSAPVSAVNAVTSLNTNIGTLTNTGFDLSLDYDIFRSVDGFNMSVGFVGNYNKTELNDLPSEDGEIIGLGRNGGKLFEYYTIRYAGVNPANGNLLFYTADGDVTESPNADTDRVWLDQNIFPDYNGSFNLNIDYKGFFLQTQFNYTIGVDRYDFDYSGFINPQNIGQFRHSQDILRAWTPDNRVTDIPALGATNVGAFNSNRFVSSADYLRLRFASIGYSFPAKYLDGTGIDVLRVFANGENLYTWTEWRGFDAEALSNTSRIYPTPRTISFGIEVGF